MEKNTKTLALDMDGTFVNFYGVRGWLDYLEAYDTTPYAIAKPLFSMSLLARYLNRARANGHRIVIISWLSKSGTTEYNERVAEVKREWLAKHLPSVQFDEIHIVPYGTPKSKVTIADILFDDEERNRAEWGEGAYAPEKIFEILKKIS